MFTTHARDFFRADGTELSEPPLVEQVEFCSEPRNTYPFHKSCMVCGVVQQPQLMRAMFRREWSRNGWGAWVLYGWECINYCGPEIKF